ncbi:hypothetical protein SYNPS1DRAFT_29987 [Syncephalis pseudoplumigaleata]|uniref:Uncharacterized protein n=1 Tax=Syncephalis pseudoplumigaleata TaxID=1712513 RepID=A0A4P9YWL0_9FUNG|nr:hypothetical protein SYNPS1DRAFT_29987 [Syncephalis pseudoplumigaleata]|eukprot:RKP24248.1 hypothetical protein SYNPS1DRAFT_29987 [Syncephalis pseudoplumigaleata]
MDIIRMLPLPPTVEHVLNQTLPQLPTLTDALTVVFDQVPLVDNKWLFYIVAFCFIYLLLAILMNTVRWILSLFTFAIKVSIVVGVMATLLWLTQEGDKPSSFQFLDVSRSSATTATPTSTP